MKKSNLQWSIKHRPRTLGEIQGAESLKNEMSKRIKKDKGLPQVMLLQGTYGTGKSTAAQIIAQIVQCTDLDTSGDDIVPCGKCPACKSIVNETFTRDTQMLDGSQIGSKSDIVDFTSLIDASPMLDKAKVYIIEEIDQLSASAKAAFHKILEKPKKNVYWILLSMDKSGVPPSIKSRCQTFYFNPLKTSDIMRLLKRSLDIEGLWDKLPKDFRFEGLKILASASEGIPRTAVQLLERAISGEYYDTKTLLSNLGIVSEESTAKMLIQLLNKEQDFITEYSKINHNDFHKLGLYILGEAYQYRCFPDLNDNVQPLTVEIATHKNFIPLIATFREIEKARVPYLNKSEAILILCSFIDESNKMPTFSNELVPLTTVEDIIPTRNIPTRQVKGA